MQSALYYPFTGPKRESFLKTALFLWDTVDFMVPHAGFGLYGHTRDSTEALEIIGRDYVPTEQDKRRAHAELEHLCNGPFAHKLSFELEASERTYDFYPQKLLHETWEMLAESRLAEIAGDSSHVQRASTGLLFGYYMMSILAVCCSQGRKRLVTDENDPYRALANTLVDHDDGRVENTRGDWDERLVTLSLSGPNLAGVSLGTLIDLRKNEDKLLQDLRRKFLSVVDETVSAICLHAENPNTVRDLIYDFNDRIEKDLKDLKRALRRAATSTLLSKEFGFSVFAATAAATVEPMVGVATIGGLAKGLMGYQDRRDIILRDHPSSWLLKATEGSFPIV